MLKATTPEQRKRHAFYLSEAKGTPDERDSENVGGRTVAAEKMRPRLLSGEEMTVREPFFWESRERAGVNERVGTRAEGGYPTVRRLLVLPTKAVRPIDRWAA